MKYRLTFAAAFFFASAAQAAPYQIQQVEPLNWWVGMKNPNLQLMVHGERIAELTPSLHYDGVQLVDVEHTGNRNYAFVDLRIADTAKPGVVDIAFSKGGKPVTTIHYRLEARRPGSRERRGFDSGDAVYLVTPDRFANGNPANDNFDGMPDKMNLADRSGRHGGDLQGMRAHLDYIRDLGFTMIWPMPLVENNQQKESYHGYAITDHYHIDRRFGSNEEYRAFVAAANRDGMGVIQDIVLNHIGTGHWWMRDLPAKDWLNHQDVGFVKTNHLHSTIQDPHVAPEERAGFVEGWFDTTMPDLNQRNPFVARYLIQNTLWWIEYANLSGLREDTLSYADKTFVADWSNAVLDEYPHLNIVGEEMQSDPYRVAYWQKGVPNLDGYRSGVPSMMDFPVVDILSDVLTAKGDPNAGWHRLYETISADFLYADPMKLMVFPDNHDRSRIYSRLNENRDLFKTALLFVATTRGIPQVYYGTEILKTGANGQNDGIWRSNMPGGWAGDQANAFTGQGLRDDQRDAQTFVRTLFNWRKTSNAVKYGKLVHYSPRDGQYVYFRFDPQHTVMVVLNKNPNDSTLDLTRFAAMIKTAQSGHDVLTGKQVDLRQPLPLKAMTSTAIAW